MSFSSSPNFPLVLPPTFLTIRPPKPPCTSISLPFLKAKLTFHLLIPTPLICERVNGRKLEDCVEVILPVGGKVNVHIGVKEEGLAFSEPQEEKDVCELVTRMVEEYIIWVG
jgi:hypothetical protein